MSDTQSPADLKERAERFEQIQADADDAIEALERIADSELLDKRDKYRIEFMIDMLRKSVWRDIRPGQTASRLRDHAYRIKVERDLEEQHQGGDD